MYSAKKRMIWISLILLTNQSVAAPQDDLLMTVTTDYPGSNNRVYIEQDLGGSIDANYSVDCDNDGIDEGINLMTSFECVYPSRGEYTIRIKDLTTDGSGFTVLLIQPTKYILSIDQWGSSKWEFLPGSFDEADIQITASDVPNFDNLTHMQGTFADATGTVANANLWDLSNVRYANHMFQRSSVNIDISNWNVSNVIDIRHMFEGTNMTSDLTKWDVSNVENMSHLFARSNIMSPTIQNWNFSSVKIFSAMFFDAPNASIDVSHWDVSSVEQFVNMFAAANSFDPDVSNWNMSNASTISSMFAANKIANPDVSHWDVSNVRFMSGVFSSTLVADPDVSLWDVSNVESMSGMFSGSVAANPDVSHWDVSSVRSFLSMFFNAQSANPDVKNWDVRNVTDMRNMFNNAVSANPNIQFWDLNDAARLKDMFFQSNISSINYDRALKAFYNTHEGQNIDLGTVSATYCRSAQERESLIADRGWLIIDRGFDCRAALDECIFSDGMENDTQFQCGLKND